MPSPFVFFDLRTRDVGSSREFYTKLFGWDVADVPAGETSIPLFVSGDGPWGGFTPLGPDDQRPPQWVPYVTVDDVDEATSTATARGASIVKGRTELPVGSLVSLADPNGATFVLWQRSQPADQPAPLA